MLDKDKLILVIEVGTRQIPHPHFQLSQFYRTIRDKFDESVIVIVVPDPYEDYPHSSIKSLNAEKIEPEELTKLLERAESICKELQENPKENGNEQ